jgi:PAS domain-containing protein
LLAGWAWSLRRQVQLRHLAEAKLAKERNLLRQVIDSDPNLILVKNAADRYTLANLSGAALYGVSPRGIVGKSDAELLVGGGESLEAKIIEHALAGQAELQFDDLETLDQPTSR